MNNRLLFLSLLLTILASHFPAHSANKSNDTLSQSPQQNITLLEPGKPAIERELAGGQSHSYQITLTAGQYLYAVVEQRGIDVAVTLNGPDRKPLLEVDSPNGNHGPEPVYWFAETTGVYGLSVSAPEKAAAGHYNLRIVELRTATDQDRALYEARNLFKESESLWNANKFAEAIPLAERALAIREKIPGSEHLEVAELLGHLAVLYASKTDFANAERFFIRTMAIREKIPEADNFEYANLLSNFAHMFLNNSNPGKAEPLYLRALEIRRKLLGDEHSAIAQSYSNLGWLHLAKGDYARTEQLYLSALAIWEKTLKPDDPTPAASLDGLAQMHNNKGDYAKAEQFYKRALELREKAFGTEDKRVASVINNLALWYSGQGHYDKAELLYNRALAIFEKILEGKNPEAASTLNNLGGVYDAKGDYDKAESFYRRALTIREKLFGPDHARAANTLASLAVMYKNKGDYDKAESYYQRALAIEKTFRSSEHPIIGNLFNNLATIYAAMGQQEKAVLAQSRAAEISEFNLNRNIATGSERQKLAYLGTFSGQSNWIVSLHVNSAPNDPSARDLALNTILRRKGRALDTMTDSFITLRRRANTQDQSLLDQLQNANAQLARATFSEVQKATLAQHQARIKNLAEEVEKLEATIGNHLAEFRAQSQPVTIAAVQSAIPDQSMLIEFFTYRPFDPKANRDKQLGDPRYVAYVLNREGEAKWVELGEAKAIDNAIDKLRQALRNRNRQDFKPLARVVDRMVMQPLYPLMGSARRIFISPDSSLNLIPFAALVDKNNRYLVERFSFTYLTSGRDLLRLQILSQSKGEPLILANPIFSENTESKEKLPLSQQIGKATGSALDFSRIYMPPLPGTADEARAIKQTLPNAKVLMREQATETALKQVHGPAILHIATHSFFLPDLAAGTEVTRGVSLGLSQVIPRIENPFLRSGLLLTAVQQKSSADDGVLTAMEASGLDLWGTKLVVLSACNTGVGVVRNGDGVYGLRRAFVLAGAESLLMSLWPVSDRGTRDLMIAYYQELQRGKERGEALRQVQLRMLQSQARRHPFYWASFIQSGEWKSLN